MTDENNARWLTIAQEITASDRQRDYGRPLPNFIRIAIKQSVNYANKLERGQIVTPLDVAHDMIDLKVARNINTFKEDNFIDTMGYAATVDDMNRQMIELGYKGGVTEFARMSLADLYDILQQVG